MSLKNVFPCGDDVCTGFCIPTAKEGRFFVHTDRQWLFCPLPTDMLISRCTTCNKDWLLPGDHDRVTDFLDGSYREHEMLIRTIVDDFRNRKRQEKKDARD